MLIPLFAAHLLLMVAGDSLTYHGRRGELDVQIPRLAAEVRIDGVLDEEVWSRAALLTGFSQYDPVDNRPAQDSTDVIVWYSTDAIHFGIRAREPHGPVRATLADRDRIDGDDYIQILLDTFDDGRRALLFASNPLGVQADGIRVEGAERAAVRGVTTGPDDLNPDFLFDSRGRITEDGYEIEIRIPFKSLRYQAVERQDWRLNVVRKVQHSGHVETWAPALRSRASFLAQSGRLAGMSGLARGLVLDVNPVMTARVDGAPEAESWRYEAGAPEFGGNIRWGVAANLTANATFRPDFSQVEADVGQTSTNERFALFFPEKRPFFLEGSEKFETPNRLIYTRRIASPLAAARLTGKTGGMDVGAMMAVDEASDGEEADRPRFAVVRVQRDVGSSSTVGLVYTGRTSTSGSSRLGGLDARFVFQDIYMLSLQAAAALASGAEIATSVAPLWELRFERTGRRLGIDYQLSGIHPDFEAAAGFVPRPGVLAGRASQSLRWEGARGAFIESWTASTRFLGWWDYHDAWSRELPEETKTSFANAAMLRGGWNASLSLGWETYAFDPESYLDYGIERRTGSAIDTVAWEAPRRINDVYGLIARLSTPEFAHVAAQVAVSRWKDVGFIEATPVDLFRITAAATWQPSRRLRINGRHAMLRLNRRRDGTSLSIQQIPRLRLEYQFSRSIFVRLVGQYDALQQDALRDPRTDEPILLRTSEGSYAATTRDATNAFQLDWLFSYEPRPGTVVFLGSGNNWRQDRAFERRQLPRASDVFFLKLSHTFRL